MAVASIDRIQRVAEGERAMTKLRAEPQRIANLLVKLRQQLVDAAQGAATVTAAGTEQAVRADRARAVRAEAGELLSAYRSLAEGQRENAAQAFESVVNDVPADPAERMVRVLERGEAWRRIERRHRLPLEVERIAEIARDAAGRGDRATLEALRVEVEDAIALPDFPGMPAAERQKGRAELIGVAIGFIDEAEMPLLDEPGKAARAGLRELKVGWPRLLHDFTAAQREINAEGRIAMPGMAPLLVDWEGKTFQVEAA